LKRISTSTEPWTSAGQRGFRLESKEAKAAVTGAVVGVLSPLQELVDDVRSLGSVYDVQEFQIGMPFAAIMTCMGYVPAVEA
jgi:hypothetical protein